MLIGEPPRTGADLHFEIFGIPVRIHPFFWLMALMLGAQGGTAEPIRILIWVLAVFPSVLVHELGHALAVRAHGWQARITLHGLGGLAAYNPTYHTPRSAMLIAASGPAAGFALAAVILLALRIFGYQAGLIPTTATLDPAQMGVDGILRLSLIAFDAYFTPFATPQMTFLVADLLEVNILWGLINLLPVVPLDGGQIAREVLIEANPAHGMRQSLWLSTIMAVGVALYAFAHGMLFVGLMFGYLAYQSYMALPSYGGGPRQGPW